MSWKIGFVVALATGLVTAVVAAPLADKVTGMHNVSNLEGARGYLLVFVLVPAAFLVGALLGLLGTHLVSATVWPQFWKASGLSIVMGQAAIFGFAGLSLLTIPRAPKAAGEELALEVEVQVPLTMITPRSHEPNQIRLSLYAGPRDNHYATIDTALYREVDDHLIVTAIAPLYSKSHSRILSFHIEETVALTYDLVGLAASPEGDDFEWSAPTLPRDKVDVRLRWRVVPSPVAEPSGRGD